jgi:hypothetical protein
MSHSPLLVRILAEVTASQVALPKGQSVTKFQNVSKVVKFGAKTVVKMMSCPKFPSRHGPNSVCPDAQNRTARHTSQ